MTEIEKKALALVNEVRARDGGTPYENLYPTPSAIVALQNAIEQHEAFRQDVSDAVEKAQRMPHSTGLLSLARFIIPKPVDPLVDAVNEAWGWRNPHPDVTENLRAAMLARGYEFTKIGEKAGE